MSRRGIYPPCSRETLQAEIDERNKTSLPSHQLPILSSLHGLNKPPEIKAAIHVASAVPLGAPCIMPSPHYGELDSNKPEVTIVTHEVEVEEPEVITESREVADIGVQTGYEEECEEAKSSLSLHQEEVDDLVTEIWFIGDLLLIRERMICKDGIYLGL